MSTVLLVVGSFEYVYAFQDEAPPPDSPITNEVQQSSGAAAPPDSPITNEVQQSSGAPAPSQPKWLIDIANKSPETDLAELSGSPSSIITPQLLPASGAPAGPAPDGLLTYS